MAFDENYFSTHTYAEITFAKYSMYWWSNRFNAMLARRYGRPGAQIQRWMLGAGGAAATERPDLPLPPDTAGPAPLWSARRVAPRARSH